LLLEGNWTVAAAAQFQVDAKTVRERRDRFPAEGAEDRTPDAATTAHRRAARPVPRPRAWRAPGPL